MRLRRDVFDNPLVQSDKQLIALYVLLLHAVNRYTHTIRRAAETLARQLATTKPTLLSKLHKMARLGLIELETKPGLCIVIYEAPAVSPRGKAFLPAGQNPLPGPDKRFNRKTRGADKEINRAGQNNLPLYKGSKEVIQEKNIISAGPFDNVRLSAQELETLLRCYGAEQTQQAINLLSGYKHEHADYQPASDAAAMVKWAYNAVGRNSDRTAQPDLSDDNSTRKQRQHDRASVLATIRGDYAKRGKSTRSKPTIRKSRLRVHTLRRENKPKGV